MENELKLLKEQLEKIELHREAIEGELMGVDEDETPLGTIKYDNYKIQELVNAAINLVEDMEIKL